MLGNDLIDLRDLDARPESFRPGWDERVFSPDERRAIAGDREPLARRWAHWGAKEAAYKLARQVDPSFVFSPSRLVAVYEPICERSPEGRQRERRGSLVVNGVSDSSTSADVSAKRSVSPALSLELRSFETTESIHVIAAPLAADWQGIDFAVEEMSADLGEFDASAAVRHLAIREIGRRMGIVRERISIGRRGKIPTVEVDGVTTSLSLSLSHHARFVGYATRLSLESEVDVRSRGLLADSLSDESTRVVSI